MASDCPAFRIHLGIAKNALVEADVYRADGDDRQATAAAQSADHELHVAQALGDPVQCLNDSGFMAYKAVQFHDWTYSAVGLPRAIVSIAKLMHDTLMRDKRSTNPTAYDEMQRDAHLMNSLLADAVPKVEQMNAEEQRESARRGER